jgi:hypothetical protein
MKYTFLRFPILFYLLLVFPGIGRAQLTGRSGNSQNPGKEVAVQEINSGSLSGDVNLFTGTYNTSYNLGGVSTLSGLSFSATLSYNSAFANGDNMPHLGGVPYGEGWNLNLP